MKFLIIDDSDYKINATKPFFINHELVVAKSYISGLRELILVGGYDVLY